MQFISDVYARVITLLAPMFDSAALFLMLPAAAALYHLDPAMLLTVVQWLLVAPILAGLAIMVSRMIFPQVSIKWLVEEVGKGNIAAGMLASGLVVFVSMIFIGLAVWARA